MPVGVEGGGPPANSSGGDKEGTCSTVTPTVYTQHASDTFLSSLLANRADHTLHSQTTRHT